ncbi:unnamed protein product [Symbiodinium sp. KB8]|nr:unnamed protein product [Symbiodinium sp. KB8]
MGGAGVELDVVEHGQPSFGVICDASPRPLASRECLDVQFPCTDTGRRVLFSETVDLTVYDPKACLSKGAPFKAARTASRGGVVRSSRRFPRPQLEFKDGSLSNLAPLTSALACQPPHAIPILECKVANDLADVMMGREILALAQPEPSSDEAKGYALFDPEDDVRSARDTWAIPMDLMLWPSCSRKGTMSMVGSLLDSGQEVGLAPHEIPFNLLHVHLVPDGLRQPYGARVPASQLRLFSQLDPAAKDNKPVTFLMMVKGYPPVTLQGGRQWSLLDFASYAASQLDEPVRRVQLLTTSVPGIQEPQVVVTEGDANIDLAAVETVLPVDLRGFGAGVLPTALSPGMTCEDVLRAVQLLDASLQTTLSGVSTSDLFLQDAQGQVYEELPAHLLHMQWLAVRKRGDFLFVVPLLHTPEQQATTQGQMITVLYDPGVDGSQIHTMVLEAGTSSHSLEGVVGDAFEDRLDQLGRPARTSKRLTVFQPGHAPHVLWVPTPLTPSVAEAVALLSDTGLLQAGTTLVEAASDVEVWAAGCGCLYSGTVRSDLDYTCTIGDPFAVLYYLLLLYLLEGQAWYNSAYREQRDGRHLLGLRLRFPLPLVAGRCLPKDALHSKGLLKLLWPSGNMLLSLMIFCPAVTVSVLDDLLPCSDSQREAQLCFAAPNDNLRHALASFQLEALCSAKPSASLLHPAAAALLAHLPVRSPDIQVDAAMLFVDGSFEHATSTWAVAVIVYQLGQWTWAGYLADVVPADLAPTSAYEGELFGQFVAQGIVASLEVPAVVFFDNTSASLAATAQTPTCAHTALSRAAASLHFLCHVTGCPPVAQHVKSHSGHSGNELVDSIAKAVLKGRLAPRPLSDAHIVSYVLQGDFNAIWVHRAHRQQGVWPQFDEHGEAAPVVPWPQHSRFETPADWAFEGQTNSERTFRLQGKLATYNTLSATSSLQRQCLSTYMRKHGIIFAGFQVVVAVSSGLMSRPYRVATCNTSVFIFVTLAFSLSFIRPVGSNSPLLSWWGLLRDRLHSLPPNTAPILLVDANARYRSPQAGEAAEISNANAQAFDDLLQEYQLRRTPACDDHGAPHPTWRSPQGVWACLDYIAVPVLWQEGFQPLGVLPILDTHAGIDHQPVVATLKVPERPKCRINVDRMRSSEGIGVIRDALRNLPACPWHLDVDDHLSTINRHFHQCLQTHFLQPARSARKPGVSAFTMELLWAKRQCRRRHQRREHLHRRRLLALCLQAWRGTGSSPVTSRRGGSLDIRAHDRCCAEHIADMQRLCKHLRRSFRHDEAEYTRTVYQQARHDGPVHLARLLRSVLKVGRSCSYKPPRVAQGIEGPAGMETEPHAVKKLFGEHFASIEAATPCSLRDLCQSSQPAAAMRLLADGLPTPVELASAFASLKHNKASGLSSIPAEFYNACPIESAVAHLPLLYKMTTRCKCPLLWSGLLAVPLPKPNKPSHQVTGYRSIALQEPAAKAVSKSMRPALITGFQAVCLDSVGGARPDIATDYPASSVQLHLRALQRQGLSGSVVFVDGVSAFYAVRRELLFTCSLQQVSKNVVPLPRRMSLIDALQRLLQTTFRATWFTTNPPEPEVQHTSAGTIPGAPLADLLFQFCLDLVLHALSDHLEAEDIQARISHESAKPCSAAPLSWLDDLAILLQARSPERAAPDASRATTLIGQYLSIVGIQLNTQAGKTEAIIVWRGPGCQAAKRETMVNRERRFHWCCLMVQWAAFVVCLTMCTWAPSGQLMVTSILLWTTATARLGVYTRR